MRVVAGAIVRGGRVLAAQRARHKAQAGLWELPGGKVEAGESDVQALERELMEELGVRVAVGAQLGVHRHVYATGAIELVALLCAIREGEPRAHEHQALRWLGAHELESLSWAPADVPLLSAVRAHLVQPA